MQRKTRAFLFVAVSIVLLTTIIVAIVYSTNRISVEEVDSSVLEYIEDEVCPPPSVQGRKTYCAAKVIGTDKKHLYLYVYKADYFYENQNLSSVGVELFPLSLEVEYLDDDIKIICHFLPAEGTEYGNSMREIFPNSIIKKMSLLTQADFSQLEKFADERAQVLLN